RRVTASAFRALAVLRAMQGKFEQARDFVARDREILRDLGLTVVLAVTAESSAMVELLAGEPAAAERELREGYQVLERMGEHGAFTGIAAPLAGAASAQGADDDALSFTEPCEGAAVPEDMTAHIQWRGVRAIVLGRQGRVKPAERLAREAVELAAA